MSWRNLLGAAAALCSSLAQAESVSYLLTPKHPAEIRFSVDAPLDTIHGVSRAVVGTAQLDHETGAASARLMASLSEFRTGIDLRDQDLREQFFEVDQFPSALLEISRVEWKTLPKPGVLGIGTATASLALHGVTRPISMPMTAIVGEHGGKSALFVRASFEVKFEDYRIQRPRRLFLKLGDTAQLTVEATMVSTEAAKPELVAAASPLPAIQKTGVVPVAQAAKADDRPKFRFSWRTPEGRGERMLTDAKLGGPGNTVACVSCHSVSDERAGIYHAGVVRPNRTLFGAAKRPTLWQGLSKTPGKASSLCVRLFMLNPNGLSAKQEGQIEAFLKAIAPNDAVPPLDYDVLALTRKSALTKPTSGDRHRGQKLTQRFCGDCHGEGKMRPPLTPGLYEAEYLIQRVRWLPGHDARQMPPMYVDRLVDTDLRHIVTFLAGDESKRIFNRKKNPAPVAANP